MLDVHVPHASHTWKDFFIHVGTICVGLLIAISLEQTVEYFHHRHQAHQLAEDLRAETLRNLVIANRDIDGLNTRLDNVADQLTELQQAAHDHHPPHHLVPRALGAADRRLTVVWQMAQQSDTLSLLPRADAMRYQRVYDTAGQVSSCMTDLLNAVTRTNVTLIPARANPLSLRGNDPPPTDTDLSLLDAQDLRAYRDSLAGLREAAGYRRNRTQLFYGREWASWHGYTSEDEISRITSQTQESKKTEMMAKFPLPEEAKATGNPREDR